MKQPNIASDRDAVLLLPVVTASTNRRTAAYAAMWRVLSWTRAARSYAVLVWCKQYLWPVVDGTLGIAGSIATSSVAQEKETRKIGLLLEGFCSALFASCLR